MIKNSIYEFINVQTYHNNKHLIIQKYNVFWTKPINRNHKYKWLERKSHHVKILMVIVRGVFIVDIVIMCIFHVIEPCMYVCMYVWNSIQIETKLSYLHIENTLIQNLKRENRETTCTETHFVKPGYMLIFIIIQNRNFETVVTQVCRLEKQQRADINHSKPPGRSNRGI